MSKPTTIFVCSNCGNEASKWFGKCSNCNEWNTCYEEKIDHKTNKQVAGKVKAEITKLNEVKKEAISRNSTGFKELDRVLGGGFVKGSLILLGGEPGIRKINIDFANM